MRIIVKFFAIVRERAGTAETVLDLPAQSTVAAAAESLAGRYPAIRVHLQRLAFAVNRDYVKADAVLRDGDELALIPPVSGGCA